METKDIIEKLGDLCRLDHDAVRAYDRAIAKIDVAAIRSQLERWKGDHERHMVAINDVIERLGGLAVYPTQDVKGVLMESMTLLRAATGTKGALKAMRTNEHLTGRAYQRVLDCDLPAFVRAVVQNNRADEELHLLYLERAIETLDQGLADTLSALPVVPPGS